MTLSRYQCRQWMHSSVIQTCTRSSLSKNTSYDIYIYIYIHKNHAYAIRAGKASINMKVMEAKFKIIDSSNCGGSGSSGGSL